MRPSGFGEYRQSAGITKDVITCPHWRPNSVSDALLDDGRNLPPAGSRRYGHCALCLASSDCHCALRGGKPSARHSRRPHPAAPAPGVGRIAPAPLGQESVTEGGGSTGHAVANCVPLWDGQHYPVEQITNATPAESRRTI